MSIINFPHNIQPQQKATCVICLKEIGLDQAVAGLCETGGELVFICNGHFWNTSQLINGWADFMATRRSGGHLTEYDGVFDARALR